MVREFPAAGAIVDRRGSITLRQLRHPRGPYLVWYLMDESKPNSAIWMARLFHIRQMRPPPAIGRWTDGRE
jgi:hypothetical protein